MADDASSSLALTAEQVRELNAAAEAGEYASPQEALEHVMELWRANRQSHYTELRALLLERIRRADEDAADGRLRTVEEVFGRLRQRAEARLRGEPAE